MSKEGIHFFGPLCILATEQYGFRNNSSTKKKASFNLMNEILLALNNKLTVGGIFCDIQLNKS